MLSVWAHSEEARVLPSLIVELHDADKAEQALRRVFELKML